MSFAYFQEEIVPIEKAQLPLTNLGLHRGLGVFDLFRARNGQPTFLPDYLDRFANSQKFLNLSAIISRDEIEVAIQNLQAKNQYKNSVFKMVLIGEGAETDEVLNPHFFIQNIQIPDELRSEASALITHEYHREFPQVKSLNYMASFRIQKERIQAGAVDILFHQNGLISETSRSNVFVVKDNIVMTPDEDVLQGITRKNLLKAIPDQFECRLGPVTKEELNHADEVFITSTIKEVMPIIKIDGTEVGSGKVGTVTKRCQELFSDLVS